ncbi:hypothetical protein FACS1894156_9240 [Bacteroidia bacterium]|nr:hypothetical protein FACS1894156_9240 [Bacteroidia bacterium]
METIVTYLSDKSPMLAAIAITLVVVWWAAKFYHRIGKTEGEVMSVKTDVAAVKAQLIEVKIDMANFATKSELREEIAKLKENDFYHTNKAILLLARLIVPKDQEQGFERIKDCILDTTPDNRRDEIKSITL